MFVMLLSLAGVPPMLGFFGKFYVLRAAYEAGYGLARDSRGRRLCDWRLLLLSTHRVSIMYFGAESEPLDTQTPRRLTVILVASTAVITVGAAFSLFGIEPLAQLAAESLAN